MIKILLLIDYSSEFDRKLLRGLVQYSKENGPWLFYRLPSYYSAMHGEQGILRWAKEWKADAIIGQWNLLTEWKAAHAGKEIVFKGSPQNVIGKEILVESKYIIVNAHSAKNLYEMSYLVLMASAKGVPTDRFIIGVTTPYLSNMGDQYGMVNGRSAIVAAAEWTLQEVPDYIKAGISVDGVEQDYFNPTKIYPNVREAINILSPTAK